MNGRQQWMLAELNVMDREQFVAALGRVYEASPWVAGAAWSARPFESRAALAAAMQGAVKGATPEQQLALIKAHPDLAGKAALAGELTAESSGEQASAGLDRLSPAEYAIFTERNRAYHTKFGFPFIICVREHTRTSILESFAARLEHTREVEIETALAEIGTIAALRLGDLVGENETGGDE